MIHQGKCQQCGKEDIVGTIGCAGGIDLCPECASPYTGMSTDLLRGYCLAQLEKPPLIKEEKPWEV